jgi:YD repeat-containing protein
LHPKADERNAKQIITTVVGTGEKGYGGDGGPAAKAQLDGPWSFSMAPDGTIFIADDNNHRIRRVGADGVITTVAGSGKPGDRGDGGPATKAQLNIPFGVSAGPDGSLYIADTKNHRIRKVGSPFTPLAANETVIPDESGGQLHVFDALGRHLRTVNALTGAVLYQFEYDSANRLKGVRDRDGNITRIERNAEGDPTAIVAPFGQRTAVKLNDDGYLESVEPPGNYPTHCTYYEGGLLRTLSDARGAGSTFRYDGMGRLSRDEDAAGGFTALERVNTAKGFEVALTTAMKPATTYRVETLPNGDEIRLNTCCCGAQTRTVIGSDGSRKVTLPDGTTLAKEEQPDPRWGMQAPRLKTLSVTTPGGRTLNVSADRQVKLKDQTDLLTLLSQTDTITINGHSYKRTYEAQ